MEDRKFINVHKTVDGFENDGSLLSCILCFDTNGTYVGQKQMNCLDNYPPILFFNPSGNEAGWLSLTQEEMEKTF